jgi:hypothetical protein
MNGQFLVKVIILPLFNCFILTFFSIFFSFLGIGQALSKGLDIQQILLDVGSENKLILTSISLKVDEAPILRLQNSLGAGIKRASLTVSPELPKPSVIIGLIEAGKESLFDLNRLLPATVEKIKFALDDLAAREFLRKSDPDLFRRLIQEGHLDPIESQLSWVLQTELKRMQCYTSRVDGSWGPGSRRAVGAYFAQLSDITWPDQSPTIALFRSVLIIGDVDCPLPQIAKRQQLSTKTETDIKKEAKKPIISLGGVGSGAFR